MHKVIVVQKTTSLSPFTFFSMHNKQQTDSHRLLIAKGNGSSTRHFFWSPFSNENTPTQHRYVMARTMMSLKLKLPDLSFAPFSKKMYLLHSAEDSRALLKQVNFVWHEILMFLSDCCWKMSAGLPGLWGQCVMCNGVYGWDWMLLVLTWQYRTWCLLHQVLPCEFCQGAGKCLSVL